MSEAAARLMAVLEGASQHSVLPSLLQPADIFIELAGEEFRKRLFLTEGLDGKPLCLRPDFTIPVCLEHLRRRPPLPTTYAYRGKIFRKRRAIGDPEFEQAGTEWLGQPDEMATDAACFALAAECARQVGLKPVTRVGDAHVFAALTEAVGLSPSWRARLVTAFGDPDRLAGSLARLARREPPDGLVARLAPALARVDEAEARAIVRAIVAQRGPVPGRSADDIAERILEQAAANGPDPEAVAVLRRYFALATTLDRAADALASFARAEGLSLDGVIGAVARRTDALAGHGVDPARLDFDAAFGRRIGYYTGFVFEMTEPGRPDAEVIAGGRYDKLIALLEPGTSIPATGFSVWLDRLPADRSAP